MWGRGPEGAKYQLMQPGADRALEDGNDQLEFKDEHRAEKGRILVSICRSLQRMSLDSSCMADVWAVRLL